MPKRNTTTPFQISRRERDAEVLRLRREDYSFREIEERTGMHFASAQKLVQKHLAEIPEADAKELRQYEREKLNRLERDTYSMAYDFRPERDASGKPLVDPVLDEDGNQVFNEDGTPATQFRRDMQSATAGKLLLLKVAERRAKMFGLDAPSRNTTTFENGFEEDREVTFRIVDAGAGHPLLQNCSPEELLIVLRFAEEQGFGRGPQPKQLGTPI